MYKIQTLNPIATLGLNLFPHELYEISSDILNPDAILVRSQSMHHMPFPGSVKVVGRAGIGVNNIPIEKLTQLGIPVLNTVGANANAVRELVIAGMLLASRHICEAWNYVRHLENKENLDEQIELNKKMFVGSELLGKTLGIIGLGNIGVKVANSAMDLGMNVIGYDPEITVLRAWELSSRVQHARNIENLLKESDYISLHVPLTKKTENMIDHHQIEYMKNGVILLNFARDGIINTSSLLEAMNHKKIAVYVTDFPNPLLKNHPQVINLPHLGASTQEAEENCAVMIAKQIREYLEKGNIINSVNFPTIEMPTKEECTRLAIVNANIPNIVAQISTKLGGAGLNIMSLSNGSRDEIAYTLIDVNTPINHDLIQAIGEIVGVIRVRVV